MRRTKIVCTIGPATDSEEMLVRLINAGMNVARVNFSHGTHDNHREVIRRIKQVRRGLNRPVAILQDLQGPKIRVGLIGGGSGFVTLLSGQMFTLTTEEVPGNEHLVSVSLKNLPHEVQPGHCILLADGNIELRVESVHDPEVRCRVVVGGPLSSHKGMNLPSAEIRVSSLTEKDRRDIPVGLEEGVDAIALSFVRGAADVVGARRAIQDSGGDIPIIAKIEKRQAVDNIDAILQVAQGIMVARGDLGVEIDIERVPLVQKEIIRKCNALGKPVITATQMLQRMVDNPRPTRAEATDVANAIFDGTDAVMLSDETAVGKYPVEAVVMMDRIARAAECELDVLQFEKTPTGTATEHAISRATYFVAKEINAAAIIAPTWSGKTPALVSRFRPKQLIIAPTPNESTLDFLALVWGVIPLLIPAFEDFEEMIRRVMDASRTAGYLEKGAQVVITGGTPVHVAGSTNFIKVEKVG